MAQRPFFPVPAWLLAAVLVGTLPLAVPAQPAPTPARAAVLGQPGYALTLGLADLVRLSLEHNPALARAGLEIDAAQGRALQAGLYPNPTVSINGDEVGGREGRGGIVALPAVQQEIITAGKLRLSRAVAQQDVDQSRLNLVRQRFALLTTVRQGYFEVLAAQRRAEVLGELARLANQSYEHAGKILGAGELTRPDVLQLQIDLERFLADRDAAEHELTAAWRRLAAGIGAPDLPFVPLAGSLEAAVPEYDFERARANLLAVHPEVQAAQVAVTRAELALRRARVEPVPNVTVGAGFVKNFKDRDDEWQYHVSLPLPVFNRNQGNLHAAQAELGQALHEVERVRNDLTARLATAFGQYAAARQRVGRYRGAILPAARESYRLMQLAFRAGQFEYLRVLQAQRAVAEANLTYIQALQEQWRAASDIAGLQLEESWPQSMTDVCNPRTTPSARP